MREGLDDFQENLKEMLSKYLKISRKEIENRIELNPDKSVKDWNELGMEKFYKETDVYLYGLIDYSNWDRLENIMFPLSKWTKNRILDYGGGIGAISFPLGQHNKVYYYDLPSKTQDFAKYLAKRLNIKIKFIEQEESVWKNEYDCIICVDVLEHLKKPMDTVRKITKHLKPGQLFLTSGFDFTYGDDTPMHLIENLFYKDEYNKYMDDNYHLMYFIRGKREIIYMFAKKGEKDGR